MTGLRMEVPRLFDGAWDSVIIFTYGADLGFYEGILWRQMDRAKNRIVFADARQTARHLLDDDGTADLRLVNRAYVLAPMDVSHAAHAKLLLFLAKDRGRLAVGSGNLSLSGYASQGECFTAYNWTQDEPTHLAAFTAARSFIDAIVETGVVDDTVKPFVQQAWQDAPWLYQQTATQSPVRHNLHTSLADQFLKTVSGRTVTELVVHAPFYDHDCGALTMLLERLRPERVQVLLQKKMTSVDPARLAAKLDAAGCDVDVRAVEAPDAGTFLHAKFLIARLHDSAICLQGSPNLSAPALLRTFPDGNIELASLTEDGPRTFDHIVDSLLVSPQHVGIQTLGLGLVAPDLAEAPLPNLRVRNLVWEPPKLTGEFDRVVEKPPTLLIAGTAAPDVKWTIDVTLDGRTRFTVTLDDDAAGELGHTRSVTFDFGDDKTVPAYPYHLNALQALASGQRRLDLLRYAGDFDCGDDEVEALLAQLDDLLITNAASVWHSPTARTSEPEQDDAGAFLAYDDLDWDAIRGHPKFTQYQTLLHLGQAESTPLSILLDSITSGFRTEVQQRRFPDAGPHDMPQVADDDAFFADPDPEDEEVAEQASADEQRRQQSARSRTRQHLRSFIRRFTDGLSDAGFVRHVGPSVIVPGYIVFNHLCRKLAQLDLVDSVAALDAQIAIWGFFWGTTDEPGYLTSLSEAEQLASMDILAAYDEEAVRLAALYQALYAARDSDDAILIRLRDCWRAILTRDLGISADSIIQAASVSDDHPVPADQFIADLASLAEYTPEQEVLASLAVVVGCSPGQISHQRRQIRRNGRDAIVDVWEIENPSTDLTAEVAHTALAELARLRPDLRYLRVSHPATRTTAYADCDTGRGEWFNLNDDTDTEFSAPLPSARPWDAALERWVAEPI